MIDEATYQWAIAELGNREGAGDARRLRDAADGDVAHFRKMVAVRKAGRPIAQILGYRDFWKDRFRVTPDTLDPRPETEHLIEAALQYGPFDRILDLGTGTGCVALSLAREFPHADILATDISAKALAVAQGNAVILKITTVRFVHSDWYSDVEGQYDLIVSNPPYIPEDDLKDLNMEVLQYEPIEALTPGQDGMSAYRALFAGAQKHLNPKGYMIFEHGFDQAEQLHSLGRQNGFDRKSFIKDLSGKDRISVFQEN
ncbi:MAG: peptide chain release factor N(5)-glutamine methyltransferase [Pseudomonadota bacterium]